ncbi:glycine betaine uptake BCCT transporter [Salisediminibacterium halotolerans]|uniref:Glycine betaine transporter n=1 Tax=Salisediminibacterium halotolerans TaxID=517425 RepID=A0A1H9WVK0_9BACI|nr:BCCT family transporter [Salisediminibacterium haloalkalitolerans]SES37865.1 glycine betaine transporter [Salisediminibacterium haloalkalitolerans]
MKKLTPVFLIGFSIAFAFIVWGVIAPDNLEYITGSIQGFITEQFGWFYLLAATGFVAFAIFLAISPYGRIKLGKEDEEPEYSYLTWFSFLFTAGMGIGLVFWGVAEPMSHVFEPSPHAGTEGGTIDAAGAALRYSFFHWGVHPWAIYSVVALTLAYFKFRKNSPGVVSAAFEPLIGEKANGGMGTAINTIVVFATIFGVATSLGFGTAQLGGGLNIIFGMDNTITLQMIIILVITVLYMISSLSGLDVGIRILSRVNIFLAVMLMLFLLFSGPTNFIMNSFTQTFGAYIADFINMSFQLDTFDVDTTWVDGWTIFYWAWWIAWAPFVGTFIARVSRGRTIREFIIGVIAVPTVFGALWFSVFGGSAINLQFFQGVDIYSVIQDEGNETALFTVLQEYNLGSVLSIIALLLIASFFITSADSATFVLGMQTTHGSLNPPNNVKLIWGGIQSATAAVLLLSGGLEALETAAIIAAFPFVIIMIFMVISLMKSLRKEMIPPRRKIARPPKKERS